MNKQHTAATLMMNPARPEIAGTTKALMDSGLMKGKSELQNYLFVADEFAKNSPAAWKVVHPRRYVPPAGYWNPKVIGAAMVGNLALNEPGTKLSKTSVDVINCCWKLCELHCPTIFVAKDFVEALVQTEPPKDLRLSEIKWAHDAMIFMLPQEFSRRYFLGRTVPAAIVAKQQVALHDAPAIILKEFNQHNRLGFGPKYISDDNIADSEAFIAWATVCDDQRTAPENQKVITGAFGEQLMNVAMDYSSSYPLSELVGNVMVDDVFDNPVGQSMFTDAFVPHTIPTFEDDTVLARRLSALGINLLLAMSALPQHLEPLRLMRPEKVKHGVKRDALWHPRLFGGAYVKPKAPDQGGTHASPRLHRRRAHWRLQRHGPGNTLVESIWIDACWVGAGKDLPGA